MIVLRDQETPEVDSSYSGRMQQPPTRDGTGSDDPTSSTPENERRETPAQLSLLEVLSAVMVTLIGIGSTMVITFVPSGDLRAALFCAFLGVLSFAMLGGSILLFQRSLATESKDECSASDSVNVAGSLPGNSGRTRNRSGLVSFWVPWGEKDAVPCLSEVDQAAKRMTAASHAHRAEWDMVRFRLLTTRAKRAEGDRSNSDGNGVRGALQTSQHSELGPTSEMDQFHGSRTSDAFSVNSRVTGATQVPPAFSVMLMFDATATAMRRFADHLRTVDDDMITFLSFTSIKVTHYVDHSPGEYDGMCYAGYELRDQEHVAACAKVRTKLEPLYLAAKGITPFCVWNPQGAAKQSPKMPIGAPAVSGESTSSSSAENQPRRNSLGDRESSILLEVRQPGWRPLEAVLNAHRNATNLDSHSTRQLGIPWAVHAARRALWLVIKVLHQEGVAHRGLTSKAFLVPPSAKPSDMILACFADAQLLSIDEEPIYRCQQLDSSMSDAESSCSQLGVTDSASEQLTGLDGEFTCFYPEMLKDLNAIVQVIQEIFLAVIDGPHPKLQYEQKQSARMNLASFVSLATNGMNNVAKAGPEDPRAYSDLLFRMVQHPLLTSIFKPQLGDLLLQPDLLDVSHTPVDQSCSMRSGTVSSLSRSESSDSAHSTSSTARPTVDQPAPRVGNPSRSPTTPRLVVASHETRDAFNDDDDDD